MLVYPRPEEFVIYEGRSFTAEWYYKIDGSMPAYEYYQRLPQVDQKRLDDIVEFFCDRPHGIILPKTMYRIEEATCPIYVFKPRDERYFNFTTIYDKVIHTNAYRKHSQQMNKKDKGEVQLAVRYHDDYLRRIEEATYYE